MNPEVPPWGAEPEMQGISGQGSEAEGMYRSLTGARQSRNRQRGDCVLDGHYVEIKKTSAEGSINQVRPVKYVPLVVWNETTDAWYVIPPHVIVHHAVRKRRGQHSENPFECLALNARWFSGYRVTPSELRAATLSCVAIGEAHTTVAGSMRVVLRDVVDLSLKHRQLVQAALDVDDVVDLRGNFLLPW